MRSAFTLIELLVVLTIMTLVMGVVVPKGVKMLNSYSHRLDRINQNKQLSKLRAEAFLKIEDKQIIIGNKKYFITKKGVIFEKSNDNN